MMRDVTPALVPPDGPVPLAQHRGFLDHVAARHAAFWGFTDSYGLTTHAGPVRVREPRQHRA